MKSGVSRFSWGVLAYTVLVILWGAFVRATGSGAGCGEHWPLCNGAVMPREPGLQTIIEFTHRVTSGLSLVAVVAMAAWVFKAVRQKGHLARKAAGASVALMIIEALIGAGLVLLGLVAKDNSVARAFALAIHLANTLLLLAAIAATAVFVDRKAPRLAASLDRNTRLLLWGVLGFSMLVGVSGAVTALGDTLFPGHPTDFSAAAHLFIRLRVLHPLLAVASAVMMIVAFQALRLRAQGTARAPLVQRYGSAVISLVAVQLVVGLVNVALLAPTWLQIVHLALADSLWIALVLLALAGLTEDA